MRVVSLNDKNHRRSPTLLVCPDEFLEVPPASFRRSIRKQGPSLADQGHRLGLDENRRHGKPGRRVQHRLEFLP